MNRRYLCRIGVALALMAGGLAGPSPASAQAPDNCLGGLPEIAPDATSQWSEPQCLSSSADNGEVPQVAIADDGSALAVWTFADPVSGKVRVQAAFRRRGETFAPVGADGYLSSGARNARPYVRLKMNKRGDAIVVWEAEEAGGDVSIRSAYKPFNGGFGAEQLVDDANTYVDPEVGIDGDGDATVIYHKPPAPFNDISDQRSSYLSNSRPSGAASGWGSPDVVLSHSLGTETTPIRWSDDHGSLAVSESGSQSVTLTTQEREAGANKPQFVVQLSRLPGETTWHEDQRYDGGQPDQIPTATARDTRTTAGGRLVTWSKSFSLNAGYNLVERSNITAPADGPGPTSGAGYDTALESDSDALVMWNRGAGPLDPQYGGLLAVHKPATLSFGAATTPVSGNEGRSRPRLATDANDSVVSVFQQITTGGETVQAALREPGETTDFGDPVQLSAERDLEGDLGVKQRTGPRVAMNSGREAVAAWAIFDGESFRVQVSLMTPYDPADPNPTNPEIPRPPPPPPPPEPAVVSPIQLARPQARDEATVLKANVPAGTRQLRWSFGTEGEPPIVGKVEGGQLQRGVRLRLPGSWRVRLEADGPDGTKTYTRSFASFKPSLTSEARQVGQGLTKAGTPPVFAVGDVDTLIGDQTPTSASARVSAKGKAAAAGKGCSPMTVVSGQQKMSGCLKPIEKLVDIPGPEKGVVNEVAKELGLDQGKKELMEKATQMTDGYVAQGRALLNDEFPVLPKEAASVVSIPQAKSLVSAKATLPVGQATYDPKNGFNLKVDPKKVKIPLGKLPKPPKLPSLGGLEIVGDWNVDLEKREAKIKASVVFPKEITKAGIKLENEIVLRATAERVIVDEARIGPIDVDIGALKVTAFKITYLREGDEWLGQAKACIIKATCFDMAPPNGSIRIKGGRVVFAGASLFFPPPGVPLFTGVNLTKVGFGLGFDPTRMVGSARIQAVKLVSIEGRLVLAFPSSRTPFILRREEVGNDFPAGLYGKSFVGPTVGVTGAASINIPELGDIEVAKGHVLYEYPGYVAFGAGFDIDLLKITQLRGGLAGELDLDRELFNVHGRIEACLVDVACGSAVANVSRGPNKAGGAGACISLLGVSVGGGVQWARLDDPFIWPFDGCKWSRFKLDVRASKAQTAAGDFVLNVREGEPSPAIKLYGQGGAPTVVVRGPDGQVLNSDSPKNVDVSPGGKIRILRFPGNPHAGPFTVVGLQDAKPGRYTINTLPGSAPVTKTAQATDQPDAKISGKVTGKDRRRVLTYDVLAREGQRVSFQEVAANGATKTIGSTTRGGRGKLRFDSAPGSGKRRIFAQFELSGVPAERKLVTSFNPASPRLAKVKGVRVRRRGGLLLVSWRKVAGATTYEVGANLSGRRMTFAKTSKTGVRFKVPQWFAGRLTVRAIDDIRQSPVSDRKGFRAISAEPSPFRPLEQCKVGRNSISCLPPKRFCAGRRATIVSEPGRRTLGTEKADVIVGTPGADVIDGRGGNDLICGDSGDDTINGGAGSDRIRGGVGNDTVFGNSGNDRIRGGPGNDALRGDVGNDRLRGDSGNDSIVGDLGRDRLSSGPNRDTLDGGSGRDRLNGGSGKDRLNGGSGKDRLRDGSRERARDARTP